MRTAIAFLALLASSPAVAGMHVEASPQPKSALREIFRPGEVRIRAICSVTAEGTRRIRIWCEETASDAREAEFEVIDIVTAAFGAQNESSGSRPLDPDDNEVASQEGDLAYSYLWELLNPGGEGRHEEATGTYTVRFGSDAHGVDCEVGIDRNASVISGDCDGDFIPTLLSANDVVYMEFFLSGNSENVLYRMNFLGLHKRIDLTTAQTGDTIDKATAPLQVASGGGTSATRVARAPISHPSVAVFFVSPLEMEAGELSLCTDENCSDVLLSAVVDYDGLTGAYELTRASPPGGGRIPVDEPTSKLEAQGLAGAEYFIQTLPPDLAGFVGGVHTGRSVFVQYRPAFPPGDPLGQPPVPFTRAVAVAKGDFNAVSASPAGHTSVASVNLASGHLSRTYDDWVVPEKGITRRFSRTYLNANNQANPMGTGWSHNYEGYIQEEVYGRYQVVLEGQSYDFPVCVPSAGGSDPCPLETDVCEMTCQTDKAHGGTLTIRVTKDASNRGLVTGVVATYYDGAGTTYEFNRVSNVFKHHGGRRYLLTTIDDLLVEPIVINYENATSDWVVTATRAGGINVEFTYQSIDVGDVAPELQAAVRAGMKRLSRVDGKLANGTIFATLELDHDVQGVTPVCQSPTPATPVAQSAFNLVTACRTTRAHPTRDLRYEYLYDGSGQVLSVRNEVAHEEVVVLDATAGSTPTVFVANYQPLAAGSTAAGTHYHHVKQGEVISTATAQSETYGFTYNGLYHRRIAWPVDGINRDATLNRYGAVLSLSSPCGTTTATWEESGGEPGRIIPTGETDRVGDREACTYDENLNPLSCSTDITEADVDVPATTGLDGAQVSFADYDAKQRPASISIPSATGTGSVTVTNVYTGEWLTEQVKSGETAALWRQPVNGDGQPAETGGLDGAGNAISYPNGYDAEFGQIVNVATTCGGCPATVTAGDNVDVPVVTAVRMSVVYDALGRPATVRTHHMANGVETQVLAETTTYDALNRPKTVTRTGSVDQVFTLTYDQAAHALVVTSSGTHFGEQVTSTSRYERGLLRQTIDRHSVSVIYERGPDECVVDSIVENNGVEEVTQALARAASGRSKLLTVSERNLAGGSAEEVRRISFDAAGNVAEVVSGRAADAASGQFTDVYRYNLYGQVELVQFGDEHGLEHHYDEHGELTRTTTFPAGEVVAEATRDTVGRVVKQERPGGAEQTYVYDVLGRIALMSRTSPAGRSFETVDGSGDGSTLELVEAFSYNDVQRTRTVRQVVQDPYPSSCGLGEPGPPPEPCVQRRDRVQVTTTGFDTEGRPNVVEEVYNPGLAAEDLARVAFVYDDRGRTSVTDTTGLEGVGEVSTESEFFTYHPDGRVVVNSDVRPQESTYYADGKVRERCEPSCATWELKEAYAYDGDWVKTVTEHRRRPARNDDGAAEGSYGPATETFLRIAALEYDDVGRPVRERQELCRVAADTDTTCPAPAPGALPGYGERQLFDAELDWVESEGLWTVTVHAAGDPSDVYEVRKLDANYSPVEVTIHRLPGGSLVNNAADPQAIEYFVGADGNVASGSSPRTINFSEFVAEGDIVEENEAGFVWRVRHTQQRAGDPAIEDGDVTLVGYQYVALDKRHESLSVHYSRADVVNGLDVDAETRECVDKPARMEDLHYALSIREDAFAHQTIRDTFFDTYRADDAYNFEVPCDLALVYGVDRVEGNPGANASFFLAWTAIAGAEAALEPLLGLAAGAGLAVARAGTRGAATYVGRGASRLANRTGAFVRRGAPVNAKRWTTSAADEIAQKADALCPPGGCLTGPSCFVAGTAVHTDDGLVPIEEVEVGDRVWSRDDESGEEAFRAVTRTIVTMNERVLDLSLANEDGKEELLGVTGEHPFWRRDDGWVAAAELLLGDEVYTAAGGWLRVGSSTWQQELVEVFNLEVEGFHTYFVGESGAWVHNRCGPGVVRWTAGEVDGATRLARLRNTLNAQGLTPDGSLLSSPGSILSRRGFLYELGSSALGDADFALIAHLSPVGRGELLAGGPDGGLMGVVRGIAGVYRRTITNPQNIWRLRGTGLTPAARRARNLALGAGAAAAAAAGYWYFF